ncbi:MAG: type II secretion system protein GspG [Candidatus Omnitrophica bacterium]|nr:type II secretion system protein GspG [Candidatus Omnitrophota bacterium]
MICKFKHSAFTLIELILVVAIIALLAGSMVPMILSARHEARTAKALNDLDTLKTAYLKLRADTGYTMPVAPESLISNSPPLIITPIPGWDGPYVDELKKDPWGTDYDIWIAMGFPNRWGYICYGPNTIPEGPAPMPGDDISIFIGNF